MLIGEDVGYFGGVYRCTDGLQRKYGESRVIDAPIAEGGIVGAVVGVVVACEPPRSPRDRRGLQGCRRAACRCDHARSRRGPRGHTVRDHWPPVPPHAPSVGSQHRVTGHPGTEVPAGLHRPSASEVGDSRRGTAASASPLPSAAHPPACAASAHAPSRPQAGSGLRSPAPASCCSGSAWVFSFYGSRSRSSSRSCSTVSSSSKTTAPLASRMIRTLGVLSAAKRAPQTLGMPSASR